MEEEKFTPEAVEALQDTVSEDQAPETAADDVMADDEFAKAFNAWSAGAAQVQQEDLNGIANKAESKLRAENEKMSIARLAFAQEQAKWWEAHGCAMPGSVKRATRRKIEKLAIQGKLKMRAVPQSADTQTDN